MSELNKLVKGGIVIVAFAAVVLISMAVISAFDSHVRNPATANIVDQTWYIGNNTLVGTAGLYPWLQTVTGCVNSSDGTAMTVDTYTVSTGNADGGFVELSAGNIYDGLPVNCSISYLANNAASGSITSFNAGMAIFATFLAVIVLALVGKAVISIFTKKD